MSTRTTNHTVSVLGSGEPHRASAWPVVERIAATVASMGHDVVTVDLDRTSPTSWIPGLEVAFIADFGNGGDDGTLQGLLARCGVPYSGSDGAACALARDKLVAKNLVSSLGAATPDAVEVDYTAPLAAQVDRMAERLGLPFVVKPVLGGGSYGLHLATTRRDAMAAFEANRQYHRAFAEAFVRGRALTAGVVGVGGERVDLPAHEVRFAGGLPFLDAARLSEPGLIEMLSPPEVDRETAARAGEVAALAHDALGCRGLSRTDMKVTDEGEVHFIELNTMPALSPRSDLPFGAHHAGLTFEDVVRRVLASAFDRPPDGFALRRPPDRSSADALL